MCWWWWSTSGSRSERRNAKRRTESEVVGLEQKRETETGCLWVGASDQCTQWPGPLRGGKHTTRHPAPLCFLLQGGPTAQQQKDLQRCEPCCSFLFPVPLGKKTKQQLRSNVLPYKTPNTRTRVAACLPASVKIASLPCPSSQFGAWTSLNALSRSSHKWVGLQYPPSMLYMHNIVRRPRSVSLCPALPAGIAPIIYRTVLWTAKCT